MRRKKNSMRVKSMVLLTSIYISATTLYADFSKQNGVLTDSTTNLEWQNDYSDNNGIQRTTWKSAIEYCEALSLDGGEWRLPNIRELVSLVDDTKHAPSINDVFELTDVSYYWSATTSVSNNNAAWIVYFGDGDVSNDIKNNNSYSVRCVRAGE